MLDDLTQEIGSLLRRRSLTLATAESATAGLISSTIADAPGSSDYLLGGVVSYSNDAKERVLGVSAQTLNTTGAVSEDTCRQMALGARRLLRADLALSDTGIAGPGGGSPSKPVGLFYIGLATPSGVTVREYVFTGSRAEVRAIATREALEMLRQYLLALAK